MISQSYREYKGGNFFETQCVSSLVPHSWPKLLTCCSCFNVQCSTMSLYHYRSVEVLHHLCEQKKCPDDGESTYPGWRVCSWIRISAVTPNRHRLQRRACCGNPVFLFGLSIESSCRRHWMCILLKALNVAGTTFQVISTHSTIHHLCQKFFCRRLINSDAMMIMMESL